MTNNILYKRRVQMRDRIYRKYMGFVYNCFNMFYQEPNTPGFMIVTFIVMFKLSDIELEKYNKKKVRNL